MRHILVGTIGYHNLRDFSLGPKLLPILQGIAWPPGVTVEEMNWGPIAIVQNFQALTTPYNRVVLLAANQRQRPIGTITVYRWRGGLPPLAEVQDRVAEAVTGVISLDNLLIVGEYFKIWPEEVLIVDVEPGPQEAGDTLTPLISGRVSTILTMVQRVTLKDLDTLPPLQDLKGELIRLTSGPSEN